ncbi:fibronectin type III domain-containing protein [Dactylosporangium sp. CA-139066]|uniref:fibronectin type III domain-containing protein n=1 Tax=Dactylosporangium sp. CA-139066 TaxID=3239930 RepID=UPI003D8E59F3
MKRRIGTALVLTSAMVAGVAGCSMLPGMTGSGGGGSGTTATRSGPPVAMPERQVYLRGDAVSPAASTATPARGPIASMSLFPTRSAGTAAAPSPRPSDCTGVVHPGVVNGADVAPGTTSAVVSWWNIGDPYIVEYQLAPVPQDLYMGVQPAWKWQKVAPGTGCTRVSATVTGLKSGGHYVFVVHALLKKYGSRATSVPEVARSDAVTLL